ncbi:MAG: hypothetical protein PHR82_00740 [Endomicrobiaceae bacterium]|nr:hypothetical protein [Endomicrobiaceae bacterium]
MNIKSLVFAFVFAFFPANLFAKDRAIVFFLETSDGISPKVSQKILASKNFSFTAEIDATKEITNEVNELVLANKLEPTLVVETEPYLPLISSTIKINDSISFDRTKDLKNFLSKYNENFNNLFEREEYGVFFEDLYISTDTFKYFEKFGIKWCASKFADDTARGIFIYEGMVVFVPYTDFPSNPKNIENWLLNRKEKIIPIYLSKKQIKNEQFMTYLVDLFKNSKYTDILLPSDVLELIKQNEKEYTNNSYLPQESELPQNILAKIALSAQEVDEQESSPLYVSINDEFLNMCSAKIIKGIIKNDLRSQMLFDISYSNIFKLSGKEIPAIDLQNIRLNENALQTIDQQKTFGFKKTEDGYIIENSSRTISSFAVKKTDKSVDFIINVDYANTDTIDIYIDMNGIPDAGCNVMLKGAEGFFMSENYWEYAIRISNNKVSGYRFYVDSLTLVKNISKTGNTISIPNDILRGNPYNWSYQVVATKENKIVDLLADDKEKERIINTHPLQLQMFKCE